ncbi:hypothetical protein ACJJTC_019659 [Scirpophaga incertulas]
MTSESSFNDSTDNESEAETPKKKKRGVRNIHLYKKEKQKSQRLLGQSYVSTSTERLVPAKSNSNSDCLCKRNCTQQFSTEEKQQLIATVQNAKIQKNVTALSYILLYVFCVHDLKTNSADFYTYHEGEAKRGPDEVCSLLWKTIQNMDPSVKELHVFSDACGGQNRNNTLIRFFLTLVAKNRFEKIYQYFPVRGHSFLQCDRNFGTAKRLIRRRDRIYVPNEYNNLISAAKIRGFSVKPVSSNEILDFKNSWQQCFKKTCKSLDKTTTFKISQYRSFEYSSSHKGYLTCSEFIDGFVKATFLLQKPSTIPKIPETLAYVTKIPINEKKMNDIKKIIQYIPDEFKDFYNLILTWPTTRSESEEE